jgi:glycosyltransferase involved in cell wall biosynthesis
MPTSRALPSKRPTPLIFVNRFFHPDHSATSQILSDLAFSLAETGHRVRVITSRLCYDAPRQQLASYETIRGVAVHRVWTSGFGRTKLPGRTLDYLTFWVAAGLELWRLARPGDIVVVKTDPPLFSLLATLIARIRGARLINWLQDIYPETAEALGVGEARLSRAFHGGLRALRDRSSKTAAMNVVLGERMGAFLATRGVPPDRIRIIPNFADGSLIEPLRQAAGSLRAAWGLDGKFVVGYSGNLGRAHEYATLLDAAAQIEAQERTVTDGARRTAFLFVGNGALHDNLNRDVARLGLTSVRLEPYQPRERLSETLAAADVHIVSLRPELEGLIVPSKFYGVAAAGRPTLFIGDGDGEIARLIARHGCGRTIRVGDGAGLARAIRELAAAPSLCEAMGERARRCFEAAYDKRIAVAQWEALLADLTGSSNERAQPDDGSRRASPVSARNAR